MLFTRPEPSDGCSNNSLPPYHVADKPKTIFTKRNQTPHLDVHEILLLLTGIFTIVHWMEKELINAKNHISWFLVLADLVSTGQVPASRQSLYTSTESSYNPTSLLLLWPDIVSECILHVDKTRVASLSNALDSLEVLIAELWDQPVALDTLWRRALWEHDVTPAETPSEQYLSKVMSAPLGDFFERLVLSHRLTGRRDLVLAAEGRVCLGNDIVLNSELDEVFVG